MLTWERLGLVWGPSGVNFQDCNSALQPTAVAITEDLIRVFVGVRDEKGVSRIFRVDLNAHNPKEVLDFSKSPVLDVGNPGCFDENGVVPCAVVEVNGKLRLYYAGYMCPERVRFIAFSGLAESIDGGISFCRVSSTPVLERSNSEPLFRAIHSILYEDGRFRVWYGAGDRFAHGRYKTLPIYNIRYMESTDGLVFPAEGAVIVDTAGSEHRVGRPCIKKVRENLYLMFFGYGSELAPYQLGLAHSPDGKNWIRADSELGLGLSESGWDNEMMAYPNIVDTKSGTYLFYNGNEYGRYGFGMAKLVGGYKIEGVS